MRIDRPFNKIWHVHVNMAADSAWTTRREARDRRQELVKAGAMRVTIGAAPVTIGPMVIDHKS